MAVVFAAIVLIDQALPGSPLLLSVIVATGLVLWVSSRAHQLLALSAPRIGEELLSDDECWPDRDGDDGYVEVEIVVGGGEAAGVDWTCPSCGEENTKEFALCWKCGSGFDSKDD